MKKNKSILISAILFSLYDLYIIIQTIYFLIKKDTYGNVYYAFLFYPHLAFMLIGTILNYIAFFNNKKWLKIATIISYIMAVIFLFITVNPN